MATATARPKSRPRVSSDLPMKPASVQLWAAVCDGEVRHMALERRSVEAYASRGNLCNVPGEPEYTVARVKWTR